MEEQMSGPCTAEVAAFDRFVDFLETSPANGNGRQEPMQFDTVIFDTAPNRAHAALAGATGRMEPFY